MEGQRWTSPYADVTDDGSTRIIRLHRGLGIDDDAPGKIEAANAILRALGEPSIVPIDLATVVGDRLELRSASVAGRPVGEQLREPLPLDTVGRVLEKVCAALDAAHGLGVVHGALTPASVLISDDGQDVWVTEFGLGPVLASGMGEGPPQWHPFSPEAFLSTPPTTLTDVYLVGCLAVALLTGEPLFEGTSAETLRRCHAIEEPAGLHKFSVSGFVPRQLSRIILRCLVKEPDERFPGVAEIAEAIRAERESQWAPREFVDDMSGPIPLDDRGLPARPAVAAKGPPKPLRAPVGPAAAKTSISDLRAKLKSRAAPADRMRAAPPPPTGDTKPTTGPFSAVEKPALPGTAPRAGVPPSATPTIAPGEPDEAAAMRAGAPSSTPTLGPASPTGGEARPPAAPTAAPALASADIELLPDDGSAEATAGRGEEAEASARGEPSDRDSDDVHDSDDDLHSAASTSRAAGAAAVGPDEDAPTVARPLRTPPAAPAPATPLRRWAIPVGIGAAIVLGFVLFRGSGDETPPPSPTSKASPTAPPRDPAAEVPTRAAVADPTGATPTPPAEPPPASDAVDDPAPADATPVDEDEEPAIEIDEDEPEATPEPPELADDPPPADEVDPDPVDPPEAPSSDGPGDDPAAPAKPSGRALASSLSDQAARANRAGKTEEAIDLYKRALQAKSNYAVAAFGLSGIYFNRADYANAAKYGEIAARSGSRNDGYQLRLGDIYYKMGKTDDAKKYWKKAAELGNATAQKRLAK